MKKVAAISAIALAMGMGSALAADLPSRKAPPVYVPPPPPLIWTGFYGGLNIGGGWNANNNNNEGSAYFDPNYAFGGAGLLPNFDHFPEPVLPAQQTIRTAPRAASSAARRSATTSSSTRRS